MASMILISIFLGLWLRQTYFREKDSLRRTTSNIFRNSVFELQDQLLHRVVIQPVLYSLPDSTEIKDLSFNSWREGGERTSISDIKAKLEADQKGNPSSDQGAIRSRFLRSLAFAFRDLKEQIPDSIGMRNDSIRIGALHQTYQAALEEDNIKIPFQVSRMEKGQELLPNNKGFYTRPMRADIPFGTQYVAHFPRVSALILQKMTSQILFSLLLLFLTGLSFGLVYNSLKQQLQLTKIKNSFISNITHELQTPITSVGVALEAISSFDVLENKERTKEYIEISKLELKRLSTLVDKVLRSAMFEQKNVDINRESIDFQGLLKEVIHQMQIRFQEQSAHVNTQFNGQNFEIEGDRMHLGNILYNLLDNALKYTKEQPNILVELNEGKEKITLKISDNGIGIDQAYANKIFEPFFRVPNGDLHNTKGYGLGLSYVHSIIKKHKGKIRVKSTIGKGSTFYLDFPK